ncbi:LrgB family protein [Starkeya koreensis]|uniref:LrgB family protein n=1 Tax=Ancylobacter koreensis TaxID=266121 RepID=A0ABT0DJZ8_9HYPH|nr:LrgB family protein [Ancylobacter koreensis]
MTETLVDLPAIGASPLFGLALTLGVYVGASWLQRRCGGIALLNPVLVSVTAIVAVLSLGGIPYEHYMRGAQYVGVFVGPATVALALPLYDNLGSIRRSARAILPAIAIGTLVTSLGALGIGYMLGASREVALSLAVHSATTPIAMGITEEVGGVPALAAAFTLITGLSGVLLHGPVMRLARVKDWRARGLGVGTVAHGLGTARMLQINATAGAYAGMSIGIAALLTSMIVPLVASFWPG